MRNFQISEYQLGSVSLLLGLLLLVMPLAQAVEVSNQPLFIGGGGKPLALLVMGRDHKLSYEAYNDASDLNQDGEIDVGYKPNLTQDNKPLDYFGYFDSYKCYSNSGLPGDLFFVPISVTADKKCSGSWSGDFLNYLTTSRMDALRRVLYGGYRVIDEAAYDSNGFATVLERAYIPQDAHSWGKEYESIARDGYDIRQYAPLDLPSVGTRHLFANVTLKNDTAQKSLLRVMTNSKYRIWEWVAIERPVAGDKCVTQSIDCITGTGSSTWEIVPSSVLALTQTVYRITTRNSSTGTSHPSNSGQFDALVAANAISNNLCGSQSVSTVNGTGNPFAGNTTPAGGACTSDNYLNIFQGQINITTAGTYTFSVDGDDAVDLRIDDIPVASWYDGHGSCNCDTYKGSIDLTAGTHTIRFRHEEGSGGDSYYLRWERTFPAAARTDYQVRVQACKRGLLEQDCKGYPEANPTVYKPTGLLHEYGETDRMAFGLLTGSFKKHMSGGTLRKNVTTFKDEISPSTGQFSTPTTTGSIAKTIDKMRIVGFRGDYAYNDGGCGVPMVTAMSEGRCAMWGNPVAEMMYEGLRYFAGKTTPTTQYDFSDEFSAFVAADKLGLAKPAWVDPYLPANIVNGVNTGGGGYPYCSKPFELVIADAPSFDTNHLPGAAFGSTISGDISGLDVAAIGGVIWNAEEGSGEKSIFIGQSGSLYDNAPTPKPVSSFGNIRGLSPEEPTREGGYYAASVAYFGKTTGVRTIMTPVTPSSPTSLTHVVKTDTFGISLSSPLPTISIPVPNYTAPDKKIITVVPFAKSVSGSGITQATTSFQPTNTIVDFFIEAVANTGAGNSGTNCPSVVPLDSTGTVCNGGRPYIKFRINYEDSEYGSDHDMDAIVTYTMFVDATNRLIIRLSSDYAAGGVVQHMGYVISGTDKDGVYLEVRDSDTGTGSDVDYFLDTPPAFIGIPPAPPLGTVGTWDDDIALPLTTSRTFTASGAASATFIKHDPLWYAAKWGGFIEGANGNNRPDLTAEWDKDGDGKPDAYFLVTNAGKLKEQLSDTFQEIIKRTSSAAAVAVNSSSLVANGQVYQARFESGDWTGEFRSMKVNPYNGSLEGETWSAQKKLQDQYIANTTNGDNDGRQIITFNPSGDGIPFKWVLTGSQALHPSQIAALNDDDNQGMARLEWLRGNPNDEDPLGNKYRKRTIGDTRNILGDIVNSNPFYVGRPDADYPNTGEFATYAAFVNQYKNRRPIVYVGGNDGMLHGFDATVDTTCAKPPCPSTATGGKEVFAYMPNGVFSKLSLLTDPTYVKQHQFYVDGAPTVIDVRFSDGTWHTVLVGGLRGGGTSYFALDVTEAGSIDAAGSLLTPGSLTESNAANIAMWEFADPDLGLSFSQPSLVRLSNGKWCVVFSNGYNSNNSTKTPATSAVLFVIEVETGSIIKKIELGEGQGLSAQTVIDGNDDGVADFVYAGDLEGNMWRFDLRETSPDNWTHAKLITAKDKNGNVQSITAAPSVTRNPQRNLDTVAGTKLDEYTYMVLFGTGQYLGYFDITDANPHQQTFYGIWDNVDGGSCPVISTVGATACFNRTNLQAQVFCSSTSTDPTCQGTVNGTTATSNGVFSSEGNTYRITSKREVTYTGATPQRGWYLDLPIALPTPPERVVSESLILSGRVIFTSILPNADPCEYGGNSWVNVLDAVTGQRITPSFLTSANQPVAEASTNLSASGVSIAGIASTPSVIISPVDKTAHLIGTTSADTADNFYNVTIQLDQAGRQSWRQLDLP